jgi:hypothetical protein
MDKNPIAWMIQFNGFLVDARILKREFQVGGEQGQSTENRKANLA